MKIKYKDCEFITQKSIININEQKVLNLFEIIDNVLNKYTSKHKTKSGYNISLENKTLKNIKKLRGEVAHLFNEDKKDLILKKMSYKDIEKRINIYKKFFIKFFILLNGALTNSYITIEHGLYGTYPNLLLKDAEAGLKFRYSSCNISSGVGSPNPTPKAIETINKK